GARTVAPPRTLPSFRLRGRRDNESVPIGADVQGSIGIDLQQVENRPVDHERQTVPMFRELLDHISSYLHCINNSFKRNAPACEKPYCGLRGFGGFRLFFGIRIRSGISSVAAADGKVWVQHKRDNLEGFVDRGGMVKLAFFGGLDTFNRVEDPRCAAGSRVQIASLLDLSGMKMRVIQVRGSWKDYVDIHTLVSHGIDIPTA